MRTDGLTDRQFEVAGLIAHGCRVKQIASQLMGDDGRPLHVNTVHFHIDRIVLAWQLDPQRDALVQIALRYHHVSTASTAAA